MLFSIIIPLYNKAHTILDTLKSISEQSFTDFEVVIVNDGSTDNSIQTIQECNFNFSINIIAQHNLGVSVARNRGIIEAEGEYLCFLDADDEWMPEYLSEVAKAIANNNDAGLILTGRYYNDTKEGTMLPIILGSYKNRTSPIDFFINPHLIAHISSTTVKKEILSKSFYNNEYFIPDQKVNEDFTFLYRLALHTKTVYIGYPLSVYKGNIVGQATSLLKEKQRLKDSILFFNTIIAEWERLNKASSSFKFFLRFELHHIIWVKIKMNNSEYIQHFLSELNFKPIFYPWEQAFIKNTYRYKCIILPYIALNKLIMRAKNNFLL
jgi:glycosyltransferase involved in cell wall biosynthesis